MMKKLLLLAMLPVMLLTACDGDGGEYVVSDDAVCYSYWTFSFGTRYDTLPGADPATFKTIEPWLGRDARQVYFKDEVVRGADPATIEAVKYPVTRDSRDYYYMAVPMRVADVASFTILKRDDDDIWAVDSRYAYYDSLRIDTADVASFKVVDFHLAVDKNCVYRFGEVLVGADPATYKETLKMGGYAMDKAHVWYFGTLLDDVDRATFVIDDAEQSLAHDKNGPIDSGRRPGADDDEGDDGDGNNDYGVVDEDAK